MALIPSSKKPEDDPKAQKQAAQEDVLLREVDDAVRQDQYAEFASKFGRPLIGLLVLGLAAFGGYLYWDSRQEAAMEADSEAIISALDQAEAGNFSGAAEKADPVIEDGAPGARSIARMLKAGALVEQGKEKEALEIFAAVSADADAPQELRDLATIREVTLRYDSMKPAEVEKRIRPLAVPGKPYFGSAGELVAMALLDQGKEKEAGTMFAEMAKDEDVPETLRSRARQMAGLLGVDAIEDVDELLEGEGITRPSAPAQK
ncbi:MAG: tetratricopeptide repeat protein [Sphingomonadaceae bacterium]|nr:tetratricopeptide repeat protein [Sphingomonadaceae bacterium]